MANLLKSIALLLLLLAAGCAASAEDEPTWRLAYRLEGAPQAQGCVVARSLDPAVVELRAPAPKPDGVGGFEGWWHPCQDGSGELCPDLSAPGMYQDVWALGDVDAKDFVVVEACR